MIYFNKFQDRFSNIKMISSIGMAVLLTSIYLVASNSASSDDSIGKFTLRDISFEDAGISTSSVLSNQGRLEIDFELGSESEVVKYPVIVDGSSTLTAALVEASEGRLSVTFDGLDASLSKVKFPMVNRFVSRKIVTTIGKGEIPITGELSLVLGDVSTIRDELHLNYSGTMPNSWAVESAAISLGGVRYDSIGASITYAGNGAVAQASIKFPEIARDALQNPDAELEITSLMEMVTSSGVTD